ncbi:hypothetical protein [Calothrix sp. NIES-2100]
MTLHLLGYENVQGFPPSFAGWKNAKEAIASRLKLITLHNSPRKQCWC